MFDHRSKDFSICALAITAACITLCECKAREITSPKAVATDASKPNSPIYWAVKWRSKKETEELRRFGSIQRGSSSDKLIKLGMTQPDGGIAYNVDGMVRAAGLVEEMMLENTFNENIFQQISRQAEMSKYDSAQVARNNLPEELIPAPLWNKGIRWDYFIWPLEYLKPDNMENAYKKLTPEDREKILPYNPLLACDEITFRKLMLYYRSVYDLKVFERIRVNVAKDEVYNQAAKNFQTAASHASTAASMFISLPVTGLWRYLIPQGGRLAASGRFLGTMFTFILPDKYIRSRIRDHIYNDDQWRDDLQEFRAIRQDGAMEGPEYLAKNRAAIAWFSNEGAQLTPHFAKFITDQHVKWFVLDPVNCYELDAFIDEAKAIDQKLLAKLNARDPNTLQKFAEDLAAGMNEGEQRAAAQCLSKQGALDLNDRLRRQTIEIIKEGSRSPLFNEMLLMTLASQPERKIELGKDPRSAGLTAKTGPIRLFMGTLKWETNAKLAMVYTLAHETWHATSKHWILNQLFRFTGPREFLLAIAGDETVASLLSLAVRDEVKRDRSGYLENAEDFIDSMNVFGQFNILARVNPEELQKGPMFDVVTKSQTNAFKEWRNDIIPIVELPQLSQAKPPTWYARWLSHLSSVWGNVKGLWAKIYPSDDPVPCDVFKSLAAPL